MYYEIQRHNLVQTLAFNHSTLQVHIEHLQVWFSPRFWPSPVHMCQWALYTLQKLPGFQGRGKPEAVKIKSVGQFTIQFSYPINSLHSTVTVIVLQLPGQNSTSWGGL